VVVVGAGAGAGAGEGAGAGAGAGVGAGAGAAVLVVVVPISILAVGFAAIVLTVLSDAVERLFEMDASFSKRGIVIRSFIKRYESF